jgi:hypothetical protein
VGRHWSFLYRYLNSSSAEASADEEQRTLEDFMQHSALGEFATRLRLLRALSQQVRARAGARRTRRVGWRTAHGSPRLAAQMTIDLTAELYHDPSAGGAAQRQRRVRMATHVVNFYSQVRAASPALRAACCYAAHALARQYTPLVEAELTKLKAPIEKELKELVRCRCRYYLPACSRSSTCRRSSWRSGTFPTTGRSRSHRTARTSANRACTRALARGRR